MHSPPSRPSTSAETPAQSPPLLLTPRHHGTAPSSQQHSRVHPSRRARTTPPAVRLTHPTNDPTHSHEFFFRAGIRYPTIPTLASSRTSKIYQDAWPRVLTYQLSSDDATARPPRPRITSTAGCPSSSSSPIMPSILFGRIAGVCHSTMIPDIVYPTYTGTRFTPGPVVSPLYI